MPENRDKSRNTGICTHSLTTHGLMMAGALKTGIWAEPYDTSAGSICSGKRGLRCSEQSKAVERVKMNVDTGFAVNTFGTRASPPPLVADTPWGPPSPWPSHTSDFQSLPQDLWRDSVAQLMLSFCMTSLRNSRMICWSSDVLGSCDSRFVQFRNNRSSKNYSVIVVASYFSKTFCLSLSKSINFWSNGSLRSSTLSNADVVQRVLHTVLA